MLTAARESAKKKAVIRSMKQHAKDQASMHALPIWEKEILPNWKSVLRKDSLRQVWWGGTMPPRYRSRFWQGCIGNGLVLGKSESYRVVNADNILKSDPAAQLHMRKL